MIAKIQLPLMKLRCMSYITNVGNCWESYGGSSEKEFTLCCGFQCVIWIAHLFVLDRTSAWIGLNGVMVREIVLMERTSCLAARLVDIFGWITNLFKPYTSGLRHHTLKWQPGLT